MSIVLDNKVRMIAWEVTRSCNLACVHCRAASHLGPYPGELSTKQCLCLIDDIANASRPVIILTGGELPALMLLDAVARLQPGVLGDNEAASDDSFSNGLLEYPQYTRPPEFRGWAVPDVLLQGNHAQQNRWKREQSLIRTLLWRPDLLLKADLSDKDRKFLEEYVAQKLAKQIEASDTE